MNPGTQPSGSQKTAFLRYHQTTKSCRPVVTNQISELKRVAKAAFDALIVLSAVSQVQ